MNNFAEIDVFVIISCPFNSVFDMKKFFKPLINIHELEIALEELEWKNYLLYDPDLCLNEINTDKKENSKKNEEEEEKISENEKANCTTLLSL